MILISEFLDYGIRRLGTLSKIAQPGFKWSAGDGIFTKSGADKKNRNTAAEMSNIEQTKIYLFADNQTGYISIHARPESNIL
jgi:hypothetical protein